MPNRTIYVADADVPTFEKAQELAGDNLSATIAQALRRFVEAEEAKAEGFDDVTVKVGRITHTYKRFRGRLLAKGRVREQNETRRVVYEVYQTVKGKLALYVRNMPDWNNPKAWSIVNGLNMSGRNATGPTTIGRSGPTKIGRNTIGRSGPARMLIIV